MAFVDSDALAALSPAALDDDALLSLSRSLAGGRHALVAAEARVAAEISRRSARELGYSGLAARNGFRSDAELVQSLTGDSRGEARKLVSVGTLVSSGAVDAPWLSPLLGLPVAAVDAIRFGLGKPSSSVSVDALTDAARSLAAAAATLDVDALARRARDARADLDLSSAALREEEQFQQRSVRHYRQHNGTTKTIIVSTAEGAAMIGGALNEIVTRRRGKKPTFASEEDAVAGIPDTRTREQREYDALIELITAGVESPTAKLTKKRRHPVRVIVALSDLENRTGVGQIEGQTEPVSIATVERIVCGSGVVPLLFDKAGRGVDQGRKKRLHTDYQRTLIATRDGKCIARGCDCPPSRAEVHHIIPWGEGGTTTVDDGVLLCWFHHMMVHNNGWEIIREGGDYFFIPPASYDPLRRRIAAERASPVLKRVLGVAA